MGGWVFALLGLLIAFTFSGAASRFDERRHLIVEETNEIGTAYLRLDLLPLEAQARLKDDFRRYVDARLEAYRRLPDIAAARVELARATTLQGEIWRQVVAACKEANNALTTSLLLSALNAVSDDPDHGNPNAPAGDHLRYAGRDGTGRFPARRLR